MREKSKFWQCEGNKLLDYVFSVHISWYNLAFLMKNKVKVHIVKEEKMLKM